MKPESLKLFAKLMERDILLVNRICPIMNLILIRR